MHYKNKKIRRRNRELYYYIKSKTIWNWRRKEKKDDLIQIFTNKNKELELHKSSFDNLKNTLLNEIKNLNNKFENMEKKHSEEIKKIEKKYCEEIKNIEKKHSKDMEKVNS